jgi:molecular chaperone IbpA
MTKITSFDLTPFYRNTVGIDRLFDRITQQYDHAASTNSTNYPPYNIVETGENNYEIQLAIAGFSEGEIDVSVTDGELIIVGEKQNKEPPEFYIYRHQGISAKKFVRTFNLSEHVEVNSAGVKDGILTVYLERKVPESAKPKSITIAYTN